MAKACTAVQKPFHMTCLGSLPVSILHCSSLTQPLWGLCDRMESLWARRRVLPENALGLQGLP